MDNHSSQLSARRSLTVVVPVYNESGNIGPLCDQLIPTLDRVDLPFAVVFVDDGSTDATADEVARIHGLDQRVGVIRLSRNFGHQAAILAGLDQATSDAVVVMDGDLQHPPNVIPELVRHWLKGVAIVQAVRVGDTSLSPVKRATSAMFYWLIRHLTPVPITPGAADFFLIDRKALAVLVSCRERSRFNRGLLAWLGFRREFVQYQPDARYSGGSKYSFAAMLRFALDAIFSFSVSPIRAVGALGIFGVLGSLIYLVYVVAVRLSTNEATAGWASVIGLVTFFGSLQILMLWLLGEYVARIAEETRARPVYAIDAILAASHDTLPGNVRQH